jgi:CRISPR-associated protein Cas5 subtype I-B
MRSFSFEIESELAHFRDPSSHAFLNTFVVPPAHTIIGLLGSCCGFTELETENMLSSHVKIGCRALSIRGYLRDLANMQNQKGKMSIGFPRARKFIVGAKYKLYVAANTSDLISRLRESVTSPKHVPYLGISDCLAYIRNISRISEARETKLSETDTVISVKENVDTDKDLDYYVTIKEEGKMTVYPQLVRAPRLYKITDAGREPTEYQTLLMSVNCIIHFRKKGFKGYLLDKEKVCLM